MVSTFAVYLLSDVLEVLGGIVLVVAIQAAPDVVRLLPAALRDAGFIGMGVLLLRGRPIAESSWTAFAPRGRFVRLKMRQGF